MKKTNNFTLSFYLPLTFKFQHLQLTWETKLTRKLVEALRHCLVEELELLELSKGPLAQEEDDDGYERSNHQDVLANERQDADNQDEGRETEDPSNGITVAPEPRAVVFLDMELLHPEWEK